MKTCSNFRTLEKEYKIRAEIIGSYDECPSHVTIRNWVLKSGYYELIRPKKISDDWIILLDHSIQFGKEKMFVILGIRESDIDFSRPLNYNDLETLLVKPADKWNGELVSQEINKLKKDIGNIKYAVGDFGSDLRKGLRLSSLCHVHDLSHLIAIKVEKIYANDANYKELNEKMSKMRNKLSQTEAASIVPPKKRKKSSYQNIDTTVKWADRALNLINNKLNDHKEIEELKKCFEDKTLERIKLELAWIKEYEDLIIELSELNKAIKSVEEILKHNGLSESSLEDCEIILDKLKNEKGKNFNNILFPTLKGQLQLLPDTNTILCSSDILESTFGKYKNRMSENPMASVTTLVLMIAAFTCNLTEKEIEDTLVNVKISDIEKWSKKHIGESLFKKRTILLSGS